MRKLLILPALAITLNGFTQTALVNQPTIRWNEEIPAGVITGQVRTTDNQPAAYVTVHIKENSKAAMTDENGYFVVRNLKEGVYTLEISMVGLKPQQKTVEVKKDQTVTISLTLTEDAKELTDVVVTTGRRLNNKPVSIGKIDINPMDLPQSVSVVGQGLIREQQAMRLSDVVKNVNGVYMTTSRGNVQESFGARGYSFGSTNLFKNGARVNSGSMPEMSSLERVEVLKGSTAILFGQVAPGGIINMVTKQPRFNSGGEVSMRVG
ncbi:MAG TPA: TonB-dependent receptor, partial [Chitinophagaceae bacterium]|nr:TonB-dependent receptor [Chitinophagaceae bacterium]